MKLSIKFLAIIALFFTSNFMANAQRGDHQRHTPEERAEQQTTRMAEDLSLDTKQIAQVKAINLTYAKKMHEARQNGKGDRKAMKELKTTLRVEKNAELKQVLTLEQYQIHEEKEAKKGKKGKKGKGRKGDRRSEKL